MKLICSLMSVSRSGYYDWKQRDPSTRDIRRKEIVELVKEAHEQHRTHGYRWTAAFIRINKKIEISDSYAYKCYRFLGIKAETMHRAKYRPRKERDKYPNLIYTTWETVDRPRQVIVSDMTVLSGYMSYFEVTFYFDVFTKEMLTFQLGERRGDRMQYIDGLVDVVRLLKGKAEPTILHTDQGSVYASMAYNDLIKETNIIRSMSRAGKPTDNPVNESLNGWIKEELMMDFNAERCMRTTEINTLLERYKYYYNHMRPCFAIGYDTPFNYWVKYNKGELEKKNTFENRTLTDKPKYLQKRLKDAENKTITEPCPNNEKKNAKK